MREHSSAMRQADTIVRDRRRIAHGERPMYHVTWRVSPGGVVDVRVAELPVIHLFVPDRVAVVDGARLLIARALRASPDDFGVVVGSAPSDERRMAEDRPSGD